MQPRTKLDLRKAPTTPDLPPASISHFSLVDEPTGSPPPDKVSSGSLVDDSGYSAILRKSSKSHHLGTLLLLLFWLGVAGTVYANQQRIIDWWKLRGYTPPAAVATLATEDTMTEYARHLFYVNKPVLVAGGAICHRTDYSRFHRGGILPV